MADIENEVRTRCSKLGLHCDGFAPDKLSSALKALSCFPMYMVANVDAWTGDTQFRVPLIDLPGSEHVREAFALGKEEGHMQISKEHRRVLKTLASNAKPSDLVAYEYALETLKLALCYLTPELAERVRTAIARMIVAVAHASGEGIGGSGPKVSEEERACINQINEALSLADSSAAAQALSEL